MEWIHLIIGSDPRTIEWWQMVIRGVFIFLFALIMVRFWGKRAFGKHTSFDIVLSVILGSILSRALTGNARFFPTLAASTAIVLLHYLFGRTSFYSRRFGHLVKGKESQLIVDGQIDWKSMRKNNVTRHDLMESLRMKGSLDLDQVKEAYLERSGDISFIKR